MSAIASNAKPATATPPAQSRQRPITLIVPARKWQAVNLAELWRFRDLAAQLAWRDIKVRYKQTLLGVGWAIFQPAMMMIVFAIFFQGSGRVRSGGLPYSLYVYTGLLPWMFFAAAISGAGQSVVGSERLITKIYFPRLAIPLAAVAAAALDALIASVLLAGMMLWFRILPGVGVVLLPVIFGAVALTAVGVGTLLAALNVAYRDVRYVIPFLIQLWMFATPSIYTQGDHLSQPLRMLLQLNPMEGLVAGFRAAALGGPIPWVTLAGAGGLGVGMLLAGCLYFRSVEDHFADTI